MHHRAHAVDLACPSRVLGPGIGSNTIWHIPRYFWHGVRFTGSESVFSKPKTAIVAPAAGLLPSSWPRLRTASLCTSRLDSHSRGGLVASSRARGVVAVHAAPFSRVCVLWRNRTVGRGCTNQLMSRGNDRPRCCTPAARLLHRCCGSPGLLQSPTAHISSTACSLRSWRAAPRAGRRITSAPQHAFHAAGPRSDLETLHRPKISGLIVMGCSW